MTSDSTNERMIQEDVHVALDVPNIVALLAETNPEKRKALAKAPRSLPEPMSKDAAAKEELAQLLNLRASKAIAAIGAKTGQSIREEDLPEVHSHMQFLLADVDDGFLALDKPCRPDENETLRQKMQRVLGEAPLDYDQRVSQIAGLCALASSATTCSHEGVIRDVPSYVPKDVVAYGGADTIQYEGKTYDVMFDAKGGFFYVDGKRVNVQHEKPKKKQTKAKKTKSTVYQDLLPKKKK